MNTENLSTLKIHKLTQAQYDRELAAGRIDNNAIYLTPEEEIDFPVDSVNGKTGAVTLSASDVGAAASSHNHSASNITSGTLAADRLPAATSSSLGGVKVGSNITNSSGTISLTKANVTSALGYTPPTTDTNTTYSAGTGISLSGTTFSNSGVRSIGTGSSNGTISVNTNGTATNVAVKGLGTAAYTASTAYAPASHGNHVPATQTADNTKFLRNDNSWQAVTSANIGAAPTSHASSATTYGKATSSKYGHVKLSDSTSSTSSNSGGIAATPAAVKSAYDLANTANTTANDAMPKSGGVFTGGVQAATTGASAWTVKNISVHTAVSADLTGVNTQRIVMLRK